jgi:hypothetical protein
VGSIPASPTISPLVQGPLAFSIFWIYTIAVLPAALVAIWRFKVTESATWLLHRGRRNSAEDAVRHLRCYGVRLGSMVSAGPRNLWYPYLHSYHSCFDLGQVPRKSAAWPDLVNNDELAAKVRQ